MLINLNCIVNNDCNYIPSTTAEYPVVAQLEGLLNTNPLHFAEFSAVFQKYDLKNHYYQH
jgi:hypothetical protein